MIPGPEGLAWLFDSLTLAAATRVVYLVVVAENRRWATRLRSRARAWRAHGSRRLPAGPGRVGG